MCMLVICACHLAIAPTLPFTFPHLMAGTMEMLISKIAGPPPPLYFMSAPPPPEMTRGPPRLVPHPPPLYPIPPETLALRANIVKQIDYYFRWVSFFNFMHEVVLLFHGSVCWMIKSRWNLSAASTVWPSAIIYLLWTISPTICCFSW